MELPIRCACGTITGAVAVRGLAVHGHCYCRDCQAFARHLGRPERMLDERGGTELIGTLPGRIRFMSGQEHLACITLTSRGPYRWYADCCRTALCNTGRSRNMAFATLHRRVLAAPPAQVERAFGPPRFVFGAKSATGPVAGSWRGMLTAVPKVLWNILYARLSGAWRVSPFFVPGTDRPLREPQALTPEQRHALRGD